MALGHFIGAELTLRARHAHGADKLALLKKAPLLVVGLGGVGAYPAEMMARAGVGRMTVAGTGVGALSSIMGMGGGAISTPFFVWCNMPIRNAIATSAGERPRARAFS